MLELKTLRKRSLNSKPAGNGPVIYWMQRDQRVHDNWAFLYALEQARSAGQPCVVAFCLQHSFLAAHNESVHYAFMWQGLDQVADDLAEIDIPWLVLEGQPHEALAEFADLCRAGMVVTDFSPLRLPRFWREKLADTLHCRIDEVDAHNIVPCWVASGKREYAARTFRPRINRILPEWLKEFPEMPVPLTWLKCDKSESVNLLNLNHDINSSLQKFLIRTRDLKIKASQTYSVYWRRENWLKGGSVAASTKLADFIDFRLPDYNKRNDPNQDAVSGLSPYLHFGHLSAQSAALAVKIAAVENLSNHGQADEFLEELVVRRELSDNYCLYTSDYDNRKGWPEWAQKTLDRHRSDLRVNLYDLEQLEQGLTHDPLWNAAQKNLVKANTMPGYLRMYWAKKILEWSPDAETAQAWAIELNDRHMLDGRDPNGYTGIVWSIAGVHDRPWAERPVFGMIRFMSLSGCRRKFDVDKWIESCDLSE